MTVPVLIQGQSSTVQECKSNFWLETVLKSFTSSAAVRLRRPQKCQRFLHIIPAILSLDARLINFAQGINQPQEMITFATKSRYRFSPYFSLLSKRYPWVTSSEMLHLGKSTHQPGG